MSVTQDTSTAITNVNKFIDAFNQLEDSIDTATAYNASTSTASVLTGDSAVSGLGDQLREMVANPAAGTSGQYTTLASIGISTGSFGAAIGTTNHLQLDSAKFTAALQSNPTAVMAVLAGSAGATLNPDGYGNPTSGNWISSLNGSPPQGSQYGTYKVTVDSSGNMTSVFTPFGGGALPATTGTITANGSNSTLIAGLTIKAGALPAAGATKTDVISYGQPGLLGRLNDFLNNTLGTNGLFQAETNETQQETTDLNDQINNMNDMLALQQQTMQEQFTAMEAALAQLQTQGGTLIASLSGLSAVGSAATNAATSTKSSSS
jgi:flagellar hook-associated protein 2